VAFDHAGDLVAVAGAEDGIVRLWDTRTGKPEGGLRLSAGALGAMTFSPDGRLLAVSDDQGVQIVAVKTGHPEHTLAVGGHSALALSPDGNALAVAMYPLREVVRVRRWDLTTGKEMLALAGHTGQVRGIAFHPKGDRIVTASWDNTVRVWAAGPEGKELKAIRLDPLGPINSVALTAQGNHLAVGLKNGRIVILRLP
jgi:WD40 repeat protein